METKIIKIMNTTLTIDITKTSSSKLEQTNFDDLKFGQTISDHMFIADYENGEWGNFRIEPYAPLQLNPANATLHYGQSVFEGMKAYKNDTGETLLFRADANQKRLNESARRMCIPEVPENIFMDGLFQLLEIDSAWIPNRPGYSLYIRPFDGVADQQGANTVWRDAQLQAPVERELVGLRFGFVGFNRSDSEERHLRVPCPTGVRKILSSNATQRDCMKQQILVTH